MPLQNKVLIICVARDPLLEKVESLLAAKGVNTEIKEVGTVPLDVAFSENATPRTVIHLERSYSIVGRSEPYLRLVGALSSFVSLSDLTKDILEVTELNSPKIMEGMKMSIDDLIYIDPLPTQDQPFWKDIGVNSKRARRTFKSKLKASKLIPRGQGWNA